MAALLTLLTLIIPINTHTAQATDTDTPPACTGTWTTATVADTQNIPPLPAPVSTYSTGWQKCGTLFRGQFSRVSPSRFNYTVTVAEADGGIRVWYTDGTPSAADAGEFYADATFMKSRDGSSTGVLAKATGVGEAYYLYAVVNNGTIDNWHINTSVMFNSMPSVIQITKAFNAELSEDNNMPLLDGNGGQWADGQTKRTPYLYKLGKTLDAWTSENTPTKSGYVFKQWSTDQAGAHPLTTGQSLKIGEHLYAQYEKETGKPSSVDFDCSTNGRCELTVNYRNAPGKTREFNLGNNDLSWTGTPISGVLLDNTGYAVDGACSDTRCWYVSLKDAPEQTGSYQAQMPTTGAPEGLTSVGLMAAILGLFGLCLIVVRRRS